MHFAKMQGLGNDYIYVLGEVPENASLMSIKLSDRHFGIGSDGMVFITSSEIADFGMRIFNSDGSEAKMCGNGIRCVGKFVYDNRLTEKTVINVETLSGVKALHLFAENGKVRRVSVEMGKACVGEEITLTACGNEFNLTPVSVGNPHAVIFGNEFSTETVTAIGPKIEKHSLFPEGVNTEFISVLGKNKLRMRVWERGSGLTLACGTGACASAAAAVKKGLCDLNEDIEVIIDGGPLTVRIAEDGSVTMTGEAQTVFTGEVEI